MYKFFSQNSILNYIALVVLLIVMRLRLILFPLRGFTPADSDLYSPLWNLIFGALAEGSPASIALSLLLTLGSALLLNYMCNKYRMFGHLSSLGGFFYIVFSSSFVISFGLHPVHVFTLLGLLAINELLTGAEYDNPSAKCFNAALLLSVGSLLWGKACLISLLFIVMMITLRIFNIRTFIVTLIGWGTPFFIGASICYCLDMLPEQIENYKQCIQTPVAFYRTSVYNKIYLALVSLVVLFSIVQTLRSLLHMKIIDSRRMRSVIWLTLISGFSITLPHFSFEMITWISIGAAVLVSSFLSQMRNAYRLQEIITTLLFACSLATSWMIR